MKAQHRRTLRQAATLAFSAAALAGCGGGGDGGGSTTPTTASTLAGTVASGAPVANAVIMVMDSAGHTSSGTADATGAYTGLSISGMTAPLVLVATDPTGQGAPLVSMLPTMPTGSSSATANVTTLTTAMAALLTSDGNPLALANSGQASALVTSDTVNKAMATVDAALANILAANQVTAQGYNPVTMAFTANRTGADAVLDAISLLPGSSASLLVATADPTQPLALNNQTSTSPSPLPAPPASTPANYVDYLQSALQTCFGSSSPCTTGVDAAFLDNGYSSLNAEYSVLSASSSAGATVSLPKTLRFYQVNGVWYADVKIDYVLPSGQTGSILTTVQQQAIKLPGGSTQQWEVIGNQLKCNIVIRSSILRRTLYQPGGVSNYEGGLDIRIPQGGVNPTALNSVNVTGPGLPTAGVWLERRNASGNSNMTIPYTAPTTAPTSATTANTNTTDFRWSYQAISSGQTFTPPTASYYATQQVSASSIPLFSKYTVTLYDTTGAQMDQVSVTNPAVPVDSSMGSKVVWNELAGTTAADVLSPSGALAAAQTTIPVTWTNIASGQYSNLPLARAVTAVQIQSAPEPGSSTVTEIDGFSTGLPTSGANNTFSTSVTAGINQNGAQTCTTACQFLALTTGNYRDIQLDWGQNLIKVFDVFQYND